VKTRLTILSAEQGIIQPVSIRMRPTSADVYGKAEDILQQGKEVLKITYVLHVEGLVRSARKPAQSPRRSLGQQTGKARIKISPNSMSSCANGADMHRALTRAAQELPARGICR